MPIIIITLVIFIILIFLLVRKKQKKSNKLKKSKTINLELSDLPSIINSSKKDFELNSEIRNSNFRTEQKGRFQYYFLDYYYPTNRFNDLQLSRNQISFRKNVWAFKDGILPIQNQYLEVIYNCLLNTFEKDKLIDYTLTCIPASASEITIKRFKKFTEDLCSKTGIKNGYTLIQNKIDRSAAHNEGNNRFQSKIEMLSFDVAIREKNIILIDDVITSGNSFLEIANHLIFLGARSVTGVFLGKTSHTIVN